MSVVGFLSNSYPHPMVLDGESFHSAEQVFQAGKAGFFRDYDTRAKIMACKTAAEARSLGSIVQGSDSQEWHIAAWNIMLDAIEAKFGYNQPGSLWASLLNTGSRALVYADPSDRFWGIGYNRHDAEANRSSWGLNKLGLMLMSHRSFTRNVHHEVQVLQKELAEIKVQELRLRGT